MPIAVMPFFDPGSLVLPRLAPLFPELKTVFDRAVVNLSPQTIAAQPDLTNAIQADPYFEIIMIPDEAPVGDQFCALYSAAAKSCQMDEAHRNDVLHLCYPDRVAFALHGSFYARFKADVQALTAAGAPRIFQRSGTAWATHPQNYQAIEGMATQAGEWLFGKTLDFAWCHLALTAGQLAETLPKVQNHDLSMVAEFVLHLRADIQTQDVDWLAWEDPFLYGRDPAELKAERENSRQETLKRLSYIVPILQLLMESVD